MITVGKIAPFVSLQAGSTRIFRGGGGGDSVLSNRPQPSPSPSPGPTFFFLFPVCRDRPCLAITDEGEVGRGGGRYLSNVYHHTRYQLPMTSYPCYAWDGAIRPGSGGWGVCSQITIDCHWPVSPWRATYDWYATAATIYSAPRLPHS